MRALRTLLAHVVDYAGLFPPAALDMAEAARRYTAYRAGDERWMLGRFVVPAARLGELADAVAALPNETPDPAPWRVSTLVGADDVIRTARGLVVDAIELRAATPDDVSRARRAADDAGVEPTAAFAEVPWDADHAALADAARTAGVALKLRTGGVTPEAFPDADVVLRFIAACVARGVPFKLTAGLHHALRGVHPLTYEPGCPRGTMHGFLNVLGASALLAAGHEAAGVATLLEERDPAALVFSDDGLRWRGLAASLTDLRAERRGLVSFGSCSFDEPVAELRALGLLS